MQDLKTQLQAAAQPIIRTFFEGISRDIEFEYTDIKFGHFSTNFALAHAKTIGLPPIDIARKVAAALEQIEIVERATELAPGFVNVVLTQKALKDVLNELVKPQDLQLSKADQITVAIDYSHPNIGKPMGVHHLLSTVLGDSIKHTYKALGHQVIADNFIGDMGTQFGKLIYAVKEWGDINQIEKNPISELLKLYVQFHNEVENNSTLDDLARAEYKKIEDGDPENRMLLTKIQDWSMIEIQAIYDFLGVEFDHYNGESFYEDKMTSIIDKGIKKGLFVRSQGALVCKLDNPDEPPAIIQKSDGASLYITRDLARIDYWEKTWHPDMMVNVVDMAQSLQFRQLFEVSDKLELTTARNVHVSFGRMTFKDQQMSTRKGTVLLIEDVIEQTKAKLGQNIDDLSKDLSDSEKNKLIDVLAVNIIKYSVLKQNRQSDVVFDLDTLLSIDGNSAPYLCYTAVRARSVLTNLKTQSDYEVIDSELTKAEESIILELSKLNSVVKIAAKSFEPSEISHYLYNICKIYNSYYSSQKVIDGNDMHLTGKNITESFVSAVNKCFSLLGLTIPVKM